MSKNQSISQSVSQSVSQSRQCILVEAVWPSVLDAVLVLYSGGPGFKSPLCH